MTKLDAYARPTQAATLRTYQQDTVDACLATGTGKTITTTVMTS